MELPAVAAAPPPPTTTTTVTTPITTTNSRSSPKLRLMCSYGGHIVPNPRTKSLCYTGGDTRIVSIIPSSAAASSLSSLTAHLAATLTLPTPLSLKYQHPHHDLLSLIPLSTDHDLLFLFHELRPIPRIRLYLFPANNSNTRASSSLIRHPKTESWFVDALESAKIMQKGRNGNGFAGFEGEAAQSECLSEFLSCGVNGSVAESMVLETSSSFGSSSSSASSASSASLSNLPSVRARDEDAGATLQDNKLKVASGESIAREQSVGVGNGNGISQWKTGVYDSEHSVASMENRISSNYAESDIKVSDPFSGIQVHSVQAPVDHPISPQLDQLQQQKVQFVRVGNHYIPQNPVGLLPVSSYYPMYHPQLHQQQLPHFHYQSNQPYPIYILPVAPAQPYNLPMHGGFIETATIAPSRPPMHPNSSCIPPQVTHTDSLKSGVLPDFASRVYRSTHSAMSQEGVPLNHALHDENQQQPLGVSEMQHEPQPIAIASTESPNYSNEPDDDPARDQIYKSQPLPPSLTSTYQSMTKDTTVHLSEALAQLQMNNLKQQIATSDP